MEQTQDEPELLTGEAVQRILSISRPTFWRLVNRGDLPAVRIGRSVRVPRKALDDFMAALPSAARTAGNR